MNTAAANREPVITEIDYIIVGGANKRFAIRILVGRPIDPKLDKPYMQIIDVERDEDDRVVAHDNVTSADLEGIVECAVRQGAEQVTPFERKALGRALKQAEKMIADRSK